ncbi:MAG: primosomal protein N' [Balneolaceae bacterium]|nr:primosomal protein N' [Balneolaceae bacterium]
MPKYIDVAFPAAVRRTFTYHTTPELEEEIEAGKRVWVPFRNYYAIGVIVNAHDKKPEFNTKSLRKILDSQSILSEELLKLTKWVSRFYYSSWGETIQAALPAGLNFVSKKNLKVEKVSEGEDFTKEEMEVLTELQQKKTSLKEAKKRWQGTSLNKVFHQLLKKKRIEIWEEPDLKVTVATEREWSWADDKHAASALEFIRSDEVNSSHKWVLALQRLTEIGLPKRQSVLGDEEILTPYTLKKLQDEKWIQYKEVEKNNSLGDTLHYNPDSIKTLNSDQQAAFQAVNKSLQKREFANYLLYGITGSGKTEVYIHALQEAIEKGKGGIVLVPEIALTPQTVSRFYRIFGDEIAVLHSRMTSRERLHAWKDLESGKKKIAIGPRSAVFAPVNNLGLIILDEEHDSSYKQMDPSPRYHARETAIMRANINNAVVVMGSATPSMQSLHMAAKGKCTMLELPERHANATLPNVEVLDLKEYKSAMRGELTVALYQAIEEALEKDEQIILLYNRRGFANYLQCEGCGHIPQSPDCSVSLTYHKQKNLLLCHYSGYSRRADTHCEMCGSAHLKVQGSGTQKVEAELEELFPEAVSIRFDRDSTSRKGEHERILSTFGEHKADILIGTQLVAKGLDFPNVTVVGVVNADTELAFPSFQSTERMYQLLSQVAGRSGRGKKPGTVYIQTRQPGNPAIQYAKKHDHKGFSREEMGFRKPLDYPPYSRLIRFVIKSSKDHQARRGAELLRMIAENVVPDMPILGPSPAAISWMNKKYIWEVLLKVDPEKGATYIEALVDKIMEIYEDQSKGQISGVRVNINVDAIQ